MRNPIPSRTKRGILDVETMSDKGVLVWLCKRDMSFPNYVYINSLNFVSLFLKIFSLFFICCH